MEKLITVISQKEKEGMLACYNVYEKYSDAVYNHVLEKLKDHPIFRTFIKDITKETSEININLLKERYKEAIINDNWEPIIEYQIEQGTWYSKIGLDFQSLYKITGIIKDYIRPLLHVEYNGSEVLFSAIIGMNRFMDIVTGIIGEAYIQGRNEIIKTDQEIIIKLNKELEQKVIERTAQLEAVNKELEGFTYSVSHDLRAPLRAVNGYAEILNEDYGSLLDEEGKRIIDMIRNNAKKMGTLIDDLLAFSRLGRKEIQKTDINLNDLTERILEELKELYPHKARIKKSNLHTVKADYILIYQVMFNLISNAVKYSSKKDNPQVEISSEEKDGTIIVTIKDNGVGFNMEYSNKLFGVFQRLHSHEEFEGTGVGLAIVQRIIAKHNGRAWGEGEEGKGATFNFALTI